MRNWTPVLTLTFILSAATVLGACEKGAPAPKHDHSQHAAHDHSQHQAPAEAKKSDEPAGPRIETGSFLLAVAPAQPKYRAGKAGELEIALEGRGEWHVNQEYPIRVDLKGAPEVTFAKTELVKDDAKEFGDEKVRFVAGVEPSAPGEHEVTCDVSFAMCTEENCILEKRTVAMKLEVQ